MTERLRERDRVVLKYVRKKKKVTYSQICHGISRWGDQSIRYALGDLVNIGKIKKSWEGRRCYYTPQGGR